MGGLGGKTSPSGFGIGGGLGGFGAPASQQPFGGTSAFGAGGGFGVPQQQQLGQQQQQVRKYATLIFILMKTSFDFYLIFSDIIHATSITQISSNVADVFIYL